MCKSRRMLCLSFLFSINLESQYIPQQILQRPMCLVINGVNGGFIKKVYVKYVVFSITCLINLESQHNWQQISQLSKMTSF